MKKMIFALSCVLVASSAFAAGGFECNVSLNNGTKYEVGGCLPHSDLMGVCSNVFVSKNGKDIAELPQSQIDGVWSQDGMFLLRVLDAEMSDTLVRINYYGKKSPKNRLVLFVDGAKTVDGKPLVFKDVKCQFD